MHNKFKIDEMVIVNGIGKENGTIYKNRIAKVIVVILFILIIILSLMMVLRIGLMENA